MNILITGGTGFIGSRLALKCAELGHNVTVFGKTNNAIETSNLNSIKTANINSLIGDITNSEDVKKAIKGTDIIFHLAAAQHEAGVPDQYFWDINVEGTRNILAAATQSAVKRVVHGSTIGVYGAALSGELNEDSAVNPDNIYGETKLAGEEVVLSYKDKVPVSIIRISETYGPGDRRLLKLFKAISKNLFFMIGSGKNLHHLIYIDDLIDGMLMSAFSKEALNNIFVLSGKEILTTEEMVTIITNLLGAKSSKLKFPMWPFNLAATVMEKTLPPIGINPPLHHRRLDFFKKDLYAQCCVSLSVCVSLYVIC